MQNPNRPGEYEFFECVVIHRDDKQITNYNDVSVKSFDGDVTGLKRKNIVWLAPVIMDELRFHSSSDYDFEGKYISE